VTLAIYPDKSCSFISAAELSNSSVKVGVRPSDSFLKVACGYFLATYRVAAPTETPSATETVVWYTSNPDVPRYIPSIDM